MYVSMPSTGFYPFLRKFNMDKSIIDMCQYPQRASIHFYFWKGFVSVYKDTVSMPSTGFYPFLLWIPKTRILNWYCVNALNGLLSISTAKPMKRKSRPNYCVNALNGLLSISTNCKRSLHVYDKKCQCPQRASIHFYKRFTVKHILGCDVSMPSTGFYPFLR